MKISPDILGRHLHDAVIDQLAEQLNGEGYEVERDARISGASRTYVADLLARRGNEAVVYEVKVLGERRQAGLAQASAMAREIGAQFRLVVVRPQREVGIEIEGLPALLASALRTLDPALRERIARNLGDGWHVSGVMDVELDSVAWRQDGVEASGTAAAKLEAASNADPGLVLPVSFKVWLDAERRLTRSPHLVLDTSDLDG